MLSEILFMESIPVISLLDGLKKQILPTPKDSLVSPFPQVVLAAKVRVYREVGSITCWVSLSHNYRSPDWPSYWGQLYTYFNLVSCRSD